MVRQPPQGREGLRTTESGGGSESTAVVGGWERSTKRGAMGSATDRMGMGPRTVDGCGGGFGGRRPSLASKILS